MRRVRWVCVPLLIGLAWTVVGFFFAVGFVAIFQGQL